MLSLSCLSAPSYLSFSSLSDYELLSFFFILLYSTYFPSNTNECLFGHLYSTEMNGMTFAIRLETFPSYIPLASEKIFIITFLRIFSSLSFLEYSWSVLRELVGVKLVSHFNDLFFVFDDTSINISTFQIIQIFFSSTPLCCYLLLRGFEKSWSVVINM